jgi:hypothetical protein
MLTYQPFLPASLRKVIQEMGYGIDSLMHLKLSFPFWSLYYWLSFIYIAVRRDGE